LEEARGIRAAIAVASSLGLEAAEAVVLSSSNRMAVRLLPCDILARIGPAPRRPTDELELDVARRLALSGSPVATLDPRVEPRVYAHSRFGITFWTYFETDDDAVTAPAAYADALARLHAGLRKLDIHTPHFTDRVSEAENVVSDSAASPELGDADRAFLLTALREVSVAVT
jgi:hypothetical protein